jgi:hypothetical protein
MNLTQVVLGTTIGFFVAQALLLIGRRVLVLLPAEAPLRRLGRLIPSAWIGGFTRYAAVVGVSAAVITLGAWGVGDYLAAKTARGAAASTALDLATAPPVPSPADEPPDPNYAKANAEPAPSAAAHDPDPYKDPDYKVHRAARAAGSPVSLKEKLLQRSEAKAANELLKEVRQHVQRSQYDCEAADRASRYLKAGLDVWGFDAWQAKYFPVSGYRGATLPACMEIQTVVDSSDAGLDLRSTVAQGTHS